MGIGGVLADGYTPPKPAAAAPAVRTTTNPLSTISGNTLYNYNPATNAYDSQGAGSGTIVTPQAPSPTATPTGSYSAAQAGLRAAQNPTSGMSAQELQSLYSQANSQNQANAGNVAVKPGSTPAQVGGPTMPSGKGSDAALLRAKDRQGQLARSALTGLRSALGERGVLGSGIEGEATQGIAATALQNLTDVNREQMVQDDETARQFALAGYQGAITQRGQDISARGQDIDAQIAQNSGQQASLNSANANSDAIIRALQSAKYLY